jgi:hypothetical protein
MELRSEKKAEKGHDHATEKSTSTHVEKTFRNLLFFVEIFRHKNLFAALRGGESKKRSQI